MSAGRPREYPKARVTTAIRLRPELHDAYKAEAEARTVSVNKLVERAMEHYLDQLDGQPSVLP